MNNSMNFYNQNKCKTKVKGIVKEKSNFYDYMSTIQIISHNIVLHSFTLDHKVDIFLVGKYFECYLLSILRKKCVLLILLKFASGEW